MVQMAGRKDVGAKHGDEMRGPISVVDQLHLNQYPAAVKIRS